MQARGSLVGFGLRSADDEQSNQYDSTKMALHLMAKDHQNRSER